jgi:hypothetical protein
MQHYNESLAMSSLCKSQATGALFAAVNTWHVIPISTTSQTRNFHPTSLKPLFKNRSLELNVGFTVLRFIFESSGNQWSHAVSGCYLSVGEKTGWSGIRSQF